MSHANRGLSRITRQVACPTGTYRDGAAAQAGLAKPLRDGFREKPYECLHVRFALKVMRGGETVSDALHHVSTSALVGSITFTGLESSPLAKVRNMGPILPNRLVKK